MSPAMKTKVSNLRNNTNMKHSSIARMSRKSIRNMGRNICFQFLIVRCIHNGKIIKFFQHFMGRLWEQYTEANWSLSNAMNRRMEVLAVSEENRSQSSTTLILKQSTSHRLRSVLSASNSHNVVANLLSGLRILFSNPAVTSQDTSVSHFSMHFLSSSVKNLPPF